MARRSKGEGSIYQLKSGKWRARITTKHGEKTATGNTKKEAAKKLETLKLQAAQTPQDQTTVDQIASLWLATPGWTETTQQAYLNRYTNLVEPTWGQTPVATITVADITAWVTTRPGTNRSTVTALQTLSAVLTHAVRLGVIPTNPAVAVKRPKAPRRKPAPLTPEQAAILLTSTNNDRYHTLWAVLLYTGLRSKEARNLRWDDIQDGHINIRRETTKTDAGEREIPIPPPLQNILNNTPKTGPWLFPAPRTPGPIPASTLDLEWTKALKKAGIPHVRIHDCRHTCGSILAASGVPTRVIQAILGHTRADQTIHYSQQTADAVAQAMNEVKPL